MSTIRDMFAKQRREAAPAMSSRIPQLQATNFTRAINERAVTTTHAALSAHTTRRTLSNPNTYNNIPGTVNYVQSINTTQRQCNLRNNVTQSQRNGSFDNHNANVASSGASSSASHFIDNVHTRTCYNDASDRQIEYKCQYEIGTFYWSYFSSFFKTRIIILMAFIFE